MRLIAGSSFSHRHISRSWRRFIDTLTLKQNTEMVCNGLLRSRCPRLTFATFPEPHHIPIPQVSHLVLPFPWLSLVFLFHGGTTPGPAPEYIPKAQLEVCLWWWQLKGQRERSGRVHPSLSSRGCTARILYYPFCLFFRCESSFHIAPATTTRFDVPYQLCLGELLPRFLSTNNSPLFQMVYFHRTNQTTGRLQWSRADSFEG